MAVVSMKALLESGVHFGHRTNKWHPRMKPYIFTERNGIHIIDLQQTVKALEIGYNLVRDTVSEGGIILFVGTKRQAQDTIEAEATRVGMPYVVNRWLGGMLTNWKTIRQRVNELETLEKMRDKGDFERFTKKEALNKTRRIEKLDYLLRGIRYMPRLPDLLFVVDVHREETAIHEANLLNIPIIAMVDTNCDPRNIDYVIPSNDDAIRAIKLLVSKIADAVEEGKAKLKDAEEEEDIFVPERVAMDMEEVELSDEDLLGSATLEKISSARAEEEALAATAEAVAEEAVVEEAVLEAAAEEVAEEAAVEEAVLEEAAKEVAEEAVVEEAVLEAAAEEVAEEAVVEEIALEAAAEEVAEEAAVEEAALEAAAEEVAEEAVVEEAILEEADLEEAEEAVLEAAAEEVAEEVAEEAAEEIVEEAEEEE